MSAGVDHVMAKPVKITLLFKVLHRLLLKREKKESMSPVESFQPNPLNIGTLTPRAMTPTALTSEVSPVSVYLMSPKKSPALHPGVRVSIQDSMRPSQSKGLQSRNNSSESPHHGFSTSPARSLLPMSSPRSFSPAGPKGIIVADGSKEAVSEVESLLPPSDVASSL